MGARPFLRVDHDIYFEEVALQDRRSRQGE